MRGWNLFLLVPFILLTSLGGLYAQEICDNGIDDDGDDLIDCFDGDCGCTAVCDTFYYNECPPLCDNNPTNFTFDLVLDWTARPGVGWNEYNIPITGDIDGDGKPEVIGKTGLLAGTTTAYFDLMVVDGTTGMIEDTIYTAGMRWMYDAPAIADMDLDGYAEVVIMCMEHTSNASWTRDVGGTMVTSDVRRKLICYEYNGTDYEEKWESSVPASYVARQDGWVPSIADFNQDGIPEVYAGNSIFNGLTGQLICQAGNTNAKGVIDFTDFGEISSFTIAADVLPDGFCTDCEGLELIAGNTVYSVDIDTSTGIGTMTIQTQADSSFADGFTGVADVDGDGDLDAVITAKWASTTVMVYAWDIATGDIIYVPNRFTSSGGYISQVNVADFDGDGDVDFGICGRNSYTVFEIVGGAFTVMWSVTTSDNSGQTGSTVFDFDGDGDYEVIYRDQTLLRIFNGADGSVLFSTGCTSVTRNEYPVVVDVDNDGETELLCSCGGELRSYKSSGRRWVPTRDIWNQHNYFNTNINEDLTIPQFQQMQHIVGDSLILNNFLTQALNLYYPETNITINATDYTCADDSIHITIEVCNVGNREYPGISKLAMYDANPFTTAASSLGVINIPDTVWVDSCLTLSISRPFVEGQSIFFAANDDGTATLPYDPIMDFPITLQTECDYENNFDSIFMFSASAGTDTAFCIGGQTQLNATGGVDYNWFPTTGLSDPTDPDPVADPKTTTSYTVEITDTRGCVVREMVTVVVFPLPVAEAGPDYQTVAGIPVIALGSGGGTYAWWPSTGLDDTTVANPIATPDSTTTYWVRITSANGCVSYDSMTVYIFERGVVVPNAFTPNNDGINDEFFPLVNGAIHDIDFRIYNRWGQLIFSGNDDEFSWDGKINGKDADLGVYVYILNAVNDLDEPVVMHGNFTLLR